MHRLRNLPRFLVFHEVVKQGSFTLAAHQLGLTKSAISQHITQLEQALEVQLLNRTTRGLKLTEAGERFFQHCAKISHQIDLAHDEIQELDQSPKGILTITAPHSLEQQIVLPTLAEYCLEFPNIKPQIVIDDEPLDLIRNNIDIALFIGQLKDSSYRARRLGQLEDIICASPKYLEQHPEIRAISDLTKHNWVATSWQQMRPQFKLSRHTSSCATHAEVFSIPQDIKTNTLPAALGLIEQGFGIGMLPDICCNDAISNKRLVRILPDVKCTLWPIHAIHPYHGKVPSKVKRFIDIAQKNINRFQSSPGQVVTI
jgi:DNA-binding transcriptional LysR family regulator